jgi:hypothetical protein
MGALMKKGGDAEIVKSTLDYLFSKNVFQFLHEPLSPLSEVF